METKDVWLLLAGAVLGYVINLTATFTAPSVGTAFSKLRSGIIERNKAKALAAYGEVRDLKSGKRDKYLYAINGWGFITTYLLLAVMACVAVVAEVVTAAEHSFAFALLALTVLVLTALLAMRRLISLLLTLGRLEDFETYRAELLRRWPDINLPDAADPN
jgi:lysylphosphatidylglycerol synthetase-like protein (DUF2156 family)